MLLIYYFCINFILNHKKIVFAILTQRKTKGTSFYDVNIAFSRIAQKILLERYQFPFASDISYTSFLRKHEELKTKTT